MKNLNLLYNKKYYKFKENDGTNKYNKDKFIVDEIAIDNANKALKEYTFSPTDYIALFSDSIKRFVLYTTYPGTIVGLGNLHSYSTKNALKLGFTFDYVTGQPYIPGSTIKGILKHAFMNFDENEKSPISVFENHDKASLIKCLFDECRVIYYDAVISKDNNGTVLDIDYITPHPSEISNPKPIEFLKIKPNVGIEFRFEFIDLPETLNENELLNLFKEVLMIVGVGAKTSVGYGGMIEKWPWRLWLRESKARFTRNEKRWSE